MKTASGKVIDMPNLHQKNYFSNMDEIGDEIYVYKGFLSQEEIDPYLNMMLNKKDWLDGAQFNKPTIETFWHADFANILKKIQDEIALDGMFVDLTPSVTRYKHGKGMEEHSDDCPYCWKLREPEIVLHDHEEKRCVVYGMVLYFSKFTGGEIYYPEQGVIFSPEPGDLIMHSTGRHCKHGVKPVIDGTRYSFAPYFVKYHSESDAQEASDFWNNYKVSEIPA
jgi:hypothetical protein